MTVYKIWDGIAVISMTVSTVTKEKYLVVSCQTIHGFITGGVVKDSIQYTIWTISYHLHTQVFSTFVCTLNYVVRHCSHTYDC